MRSSALKAVGSRSVWLLVIAVILAAAPRAGAQPLLGEIKWVPYDFTPVGWADCDGQLMRISQNTALFSLLGTTFGGDGVTTFAVPDMRGRVSLHVGQGSGLSDRVLGEVGGEETHTLTVAEIPSHDHGVSSHTHSVPALAVDVKASSADATSSTAQGNVLATAAAAVGGNDQEKGKHKGADKDVDVATNIYNAGPASVSLAAGSAMTLPGTTGGGSGTTMATGGGGAHQNMPPYLAVRCIIATQGIFPTRQ